MRSNLRWLPEDSEQLTQRARAAGLPGEFRVFTSLPSTQDYLQVLPETELIDGLVAVADFQSEGHGRLGRKWLSEPGSGALFSVALELDEVPATLPLAVGLAVHDAAQPRLPAARLKWPNDLVVPVAAGQPLKLAGSVISLRPVRGRTFAVIGAGVNLQLAPEDRPTDFARALADFAVAFDRDELVVAVVVALHSRLAAPERWLADYEQVCCTLGEPVRAELVDGTQVLGRATRLDASGALIIQTESGEQVVQAGDLTHLRTT